MPRRKKDDDGTGAPALPAEKPEGISQEAWDLAPLVGHNLATATAILDICEGKRPPKDASEVTALVKASAANQTKALNKYTSLREGIGAKLMAAFSEYEAASARTAALTRLFSDPRAIIRDRQNGAPTPSGTDVQTGEHAT